jgi:hypothetical protein
VPGNGFPFGSNAGDGNLFYKRQGLFHFITPIWIYLVSGSISGFNPLYHRQNNIGGNRKTNSQQRRSQM